MEPWHGWRLTLACAILAAGCAVRAPSTSLTQEGQATAGGGPRTIIAGVKTPLPFLYGQLNSSNTNAGGGPEVAAMVSSGLTVVDNRSERVPQLGEAVPSLENGLWTLLPDGRMELTWRLLAGARWPDGASLTAQDLAFTLQVYQDSAFPALRSRVYELIEGVVISDDRTLVTRWKAPYIHADELFGPVPQVLPRHLLEQSYAQDRVGFLDQAYFSQQLVGTGPFKLRAWDIGSGLVLEAFVDYARGRPRVDVVEIRYITDDNALIAATLSGSVDLVLGAPISIEQALNVRGQWPGGRAEFMALEDWLQIYPQFVGPAEPLILNPRFRRALLSAIDRQGMADSLQSGVVPVADSFISPRSPYYPAIESSIVRYPYDARQAARMVEDLGYRREADGMFVDASGRRLSVGIQVTRAQEIQVKTALSVEDYWRQIGVGVEVDIVPVQLAQDLEYRANFPGFAVQRQPAGEDDIPRLHSSEARLASRGYRGSNNARYMNPEMDAMVDRYQVAVAIPERTEVIRQMVHRVTDEVIWMGMFFDTQPSLISNRLVNVGAKADKSRQTWNAHEWGVT